MFQSFLEQHDAAAWQRAIDALVADIHEVDKDATQIWFHFFPLELADAIAQSANLSDLVVALRLEGNFRLADQIDSSHWFLYGHRYWKPVKAAIIEQAGSSTVPSSLELPALVRQIARRAGVAAEPLLLGITAVGLMTLRQVGLDAFRTGSGIAEAPQGTLARSPEKVVAARKRNDSQGIAGIFRGIRAQYTVRFDERRPEATFTIINQQHLTTASANDTRDYSGKGPAEAGHHRGSVEGPIPAQCRTASCGTCWVGVLGGSERLSEVDAHEKRRMKEFGYIESEAPRPVIRLACQALASGNATIVIPPWNGFIGKRKGSRQTGAVPQQR